MATIAQLLKALPEDITRDESASEVERLSLRPVPVGRVRRMRLLATLQARIAAAYLFYWIRGWFADANERERLLAETHWRSALRLLDSMGYLRGAVMKMGQTLASFPDIAPREFVETLDQLTFNAPPMHWSLLREMVYQELGADPADVFASFDKTAFAAASFGQVHRARLKSGEDVAVKIQYPGIARTVREDLRNLQMFMLPQRLSRDWENVREQFDDVLTRLERETDYIREAATVQKVRALFRDQDGIIVPRVFPEFSTQRLLTMERLPGVHLEQFLAGNPSQEARNEYGRKFCRAWYRMLYAGRTVHVDLNSGNFIFMDDGRLGVVDFGCMVELDDGLWELFRKMDRPLTTGDRDARVAVLKEWASVGEGPAEQDRMRLMDEYCRLCWRPRSDGGEFDFGDESYLRSTIDIFTEMARKRYARGHATSPMMMRQQFGVAAMLYRLRAKFAIAPIAEEEVRVTGWDRSDYAPARG